MSAVDEMQHSADLALQAASDLPEAQRDPAGTDALRAMLHRYYRDVAPEDVAGHDPRDLLGAFISERRLAEHRAPGTAAVRAYTPSVDEHGWACGHSVVELVTDDMPFLVDSVIAELTREGRALHLVVHPQFVVRRDGDGNLIEVLDVEPHTDDVPEDALTESWIQVEVDRESDEAELRELQDSLQKVLSDIRDAVADWPQMLAACRDTADQLRATPPKGMPADEVDETVAFLDWLVDNHFTFLGYREYELERKDHDLALHALPDSGLGILRQDAPHSTSFANLPPEIREKATEPRLLIVTKANSRSTVHRPAYLDYVGVKQFDARGKVTGERRFLGLFAASAYTESVAHIPVLRAKVEEVARLSGYVPGSHSARDLLLFCERYPRDELFQVPVAELLATSRSVMHLQERRQTRLFLHRDPYARFYSALVYLPRDRYNTRVREALQDILAEEFGAESVDYSALLTESVLARLHFVVRLPKGDRAAPQPSAAELAELESRVRAATRSWEDDLQDALQADLGEESAAGYLAEYANRIPEAYKEDFPARIAVGDLRRLHGLDDSATAVAMYQPLESREGTRRFKLFHAGDEVSLTDVLPILQSLGVEVTDERPYRFDPADGETADWIYDFGLKLEGADVLPEADSLPARFCEAFLAAEAGRLEVDGVLGLVTQAGLTARQASFVQAWVQYVRQVGSQFSTRYVEQALLQNADFARALVDWFEAAHDPSRAAAPTAAGHADHVAELKARVYSLLDAVASLDADRILRQLAGIVGAILRTNAFRTGPDGTPHPWLSFKISSRDVPEMPLPHPKFEIWVCSPSVSGVHLRFGSVARGGLRWSDRREDFRTEVLGLVKAQMVKNAVIVPTGSKGGFVVKQPLDPGVDRDAWMAQGKAAYVTFISGLLDLTDNIVGGEVVPPPDVVRLDGDDPYLVVAADKGTATFSDLANSVSADYGFWLGDAFASGGSAGYDHKAMGITARGAWESVKRHFRELGVNTQDEDFTVVGIGDMSGDVFGNGMLLSEHIRLVAAFDHRDIFIDPTPDAARTFVERKRLFELPRSSWQDFSPELISAGGGVFSRSLKSIPITPEMREALGLPGVDQLSPPALLQHILQAPVDLVWNGGIGTYVKAAEESDLEVGDKANDAIRINGAQLRAKVVGEGGNLGFTQLGRIEAAHAGVALNTDAIDNSAGVDTSDHEVNIKILLDSIVADGDLTMKQRNETLAEMTDDVGRMVLRNNYLQNVLLGNARVQQHSMLGVHQRFMQQLEVDGLLDRLIEFLPDDAAIAEIDDAGFGLCSPELSVLIAYSKIALTEALEDADLSNEPYFQRILEDYFPPLLRERYSAQMPNHRLHEEITATVLANDIVNRGGITFYFRLHEETGATAEDAARAYTVAREIFDLPEFYRRIEELDNKIPTEAQAALFLEVRRSLDRATRWFITQRGAKIDVAGEIEKFSAPIRELAPHVPGMLLGIERERMQARTDELVALGAPEDLARDVAALLDVFALLDVVEIADRSRSLGSDELASPEEVARLYFALSERYDVDHMLTQISHLERQDRWSALARGAMRSDLYAALAALTSRVLRATESEPDPTPRIMAWEETNRLGQERARATLDEIRAVEEPDIATLSVALRTIRTIVAQSVQRDSGARKDAAGTGSGTGGDADGDPGDDTAGGSAETAQATGG